MVTSSSFTPVSNTYPTSSSSYYYTPGTKYVSRLANSVFGSLQRRKLPNGLDVLYPHVTQTSTSKKLTGKQPVTVGLYNKERMKRAGYKGNFVVWPPQQEGEKLEL